MAPEGFKVWKMPKFKMAVTGASADWFGSDLGGSHFLATKCFWHQIAGQGCVTAKVNPSNSAVCGPNQLISLRPLFLCRKWIWHQIFSCIWSAVACRNPVFCRQQLTTHLQYFGAKLIFYMKLRGPKEIIWFGPQTAELEGSTFAVTQPHPSIWCLKHFVAKKSLPPKSDANRSADATVAAILNFSIFQTLKPFGAKTDGPISPNFVTSPGEWSSICGSSFIPFRSAVSKLEGGLQHKILTV